MFYRRRRDGARFGGLGRSLFIDTSHTGACTGFLNPVGTRVKGVDCMVYTVIKNTLTLGRINKFALNNLTDFLAFGGDFDVPVGRIDRRLGTVIVTLTNTRHVFALLSRGIRISRNCIALIGTGRRGKGLARDRGHANQ